MIFLIAFAVPALTQPDNNGAEVGKEKDSSWCHIPTFAYGTGIVETTNWQGFLNHNGKWKLTCQGQIDTNFPEKSVKYTW